jgi:lysophospholipase L1-like esterase
MLLTAANSSDVPRRVLLAAAVALAIGGHAASAASPGVGAGAMRPAPAQPGVQRIWALGDSITLGASWPNSTPGGYRTGLDQMLAHDGFAHRFVGTSALNSSLTLDEDGQVWHDGHGGYRIDQVMTDLDGIAHAASDGGGRWLTGTRTRVGISPDVVLIHLGTNDVLQDWDTRRFPTRSGRADFSNSRQRAEFVADMTGRLASLIQRIQTLRPSCRIIVATIAPLAGSRFTNAVADYAVSVRKLVSRLRAEQRLVSLADVYAAFMMSAAPGSPVAPGLLSNDNIHPTPAGYTLIARTFAATVEESWSASGTRSPS